MAKRIRIGSLAGWVVHLKYRATGNQGNNCWVAGSEQEIPAHRRYCGEKHLTKVYPEELEDVK